MKFIGSFLFCLVLAVSVKALTKEQKIEVMMPLVMECKAQEKASDADVAEILKHEIPSTLGGNCLHACIQAKLGVIKNGALSPAGVVDFTSKLEEGDEAIEAKIKVAREMAEACMGVSSGDRCDLAFQIRICMEGEANKRGVANSY